MDPIKLDYGNLISPGNSLGVRNQDLNGVLGERFKEVIVSVDARRSAGDFGFFELPYLEELSKDTAALAETLQKRFSDLAVIGIGGSALGVRALRDALLGPDWNNSSSEKRYGYPRLHLLDNPDDKSLTALLSGMDPSRTLFSVVSKSGQTIETLAQYLVARDWIASSVGEENAEDHFLFITDPNHGPLRYIAETEEVLSLPIPENVSGRFSILSPAGLFPAGLCGIDVEGLLRGAAMMDKRCKTHELTENPAGILATLLYHAHIQNSQGIHVLMPYADRLRSTSQWFQQLWAESLGKSSSSGGKDQRTGPTPLVALGAVDQHSLLQLFMEGPRDKVVIFVKVEGSDSPVLIPDLHPDISELSFLAGHTIDELLVAEWRATAEALSQVGCPNATIHLPSVEAGTMGQLLMMLKISTVIAAELYGVDPLGQPGVELGKELARSLISRERGETEEIERSELKWLI